MLQLRERRLLCPERSQAGGIGWLQCTSSSPSAPTPVPCSYVSGGFYARNDGKLWIHTMLITANLFPITCFGIAFVLNTIAVMYHSLAAVPFGTIVLVRSLSDEKKSNENINTTSTPTPKNTDTPTPTNKQRQHKH